jgi:signal transduction histidine kinase/ActR/RegA family two-component response regulator
MIKSVKYLSEAYLKEGWEGLLSIEELPRMVFLGVLGVYLQLLPTGRVTYSRVLATVISFVVYRMLLIVFYHFGMAWFYLSVAGYNILIPVLVTDVGRMVTAHQKMAVILFYVIVVFSSLLHGWGTTVHIDVTWSLVSLLTVQILILTPCAFFMYTTDQNSQTVVAELKSLLRKSRATSEARTVFFSHITHDLRTPIHAITSLITLFEQTKLDATQKSFTSSVKAACHNLTSVINNILDFSKLEKGKMEFAQKSFDLFQLIQNATDSMAPLAEQKNLDLHVDIRVPFGYRQVVSDEVNLGRVLTNLLSNAIKFTDKGTVWIRVSCSFEKPTSDVGHHIHTTKVSMSESSLRKNLVLKFKFEVHDTGKGMKREFIRDHLFDPFAQESQLHSQGTGLGLALSQHIVSQMGGHIEVKSEVNKGSSFSFDLLLPVNLNDSKWVRIEKAKKLLPFKLTCHMWQDHPDAEALRVVKLAVTEWGDLVESLVMIDRKADSPPPSPNHPQCHLYFLIHCAKMSDQESHATLLKHIELLSQSKVKFVSIVFISRARTESLVLQDALYKLVEAQQSWNMVSLLLPLTPLKVYDTIESSIEFLGTQSTASQYSDLQYGDFEGQRKQRPSDVKVGLKINVLVAEDNPMIANVLSMLLRKNRMSHSLAQNGQIAWDMWCASPSKYNVILMDLHMPIMDGITAVRQIRKYERRVAPASNATCIIFMSASASSAEMDQAIAAGGDYYLTKPVEFSRLLDTIKKWSSRWQ